MLVTLLRRVAAGAGLALAIMLAFGTGPAGATTSARLLDSSTGQAVTQRPGDVAATARRATHSAVVTAGLQAAINKSLAREPVTSPAGLSLTWGKRGTVWLRASKDPTASFGLRPVSLGRSSSEALSPGGFVFGPTRTTEALGDGLSVWYRASTSGFEQGFSAARRPAGAAESFSIVLGYTGLHATATGSRGLTISGSRGPVMTYSALRATDATGRALPARLVLRPGQLRIVVDDAGATYPVTIDPYIAPLPTPVATFTGASSYEYLGSSVALSTDGRTALMGAPYAVDGHGAAYVYSEAGGTWSNTPAASFTTSSSEEHLGGSVALSADGQVALVGAPGASSGNGVTSVYSEAGGTWSTTPAATFSGSSSEELGYSVALSASGEAALVGAPYAEADENGAAYLYSAPTVTVDVSGSQTYGSSSPIFSYTDDAPSGLTVSGTLTCTTVDGGTSIRASLAAGTHTLDGSSCSGLSLSGTDASAYSISYTGVTDGFVVSKANQTITFTSTNPSPVTVGGATYTPTATATSGLTVSFTIDGSSTSGACSISAGVVSFAGAGTCVVDANQAGNTNWNAAPQVQQSITVTVSKANQTITFTLLVKHRSLAQPPLIVHASASSGLTVSFSTSTPSVCTAKQVGGGAVVALHRPGTCIVVASQAGNASYAPAPPVRRSFTVSKAGQTIKFAPLPNQAPAGSTITVRASASSGLTVSFTTTTPLVCTLVQTRAGARLSLLRAGKCTVVAHQAGNATYSAAAIVGRSFTVSARLTT